MINKSVGTLKRGMWNHIFSYVAANVAQVVVWALATPDQFFWPLWSIVGWGVGLVAHIWVAQWAIRARATS